MNRRRFFAGLGAAVAAVAVTTRLGESVLKLAPGDGVALNAALHPGTEWFVRPDDDASIPRLSEEALEQMCIEIDKLRYSGRRISIVPTHVVFGGVKP